MAYDNKLTFTLGKNNKGDNPKRPDYRGELIDEHGQTWDLSGWIRENKAKGTKFISGRLQKRQSRVQDDAGAGIEAENQPQNAPRSPKASEFLE